MKPSQMKALLDGSGLKLTKPKPTDAVYQQIFGAEIAEPINWLYWLPVKEFQTVPFCVTFSRLNCAETISKKTGEELNFSDRYLGVIAGTTKQGNSLDNVSDFFRNKGTPLDKDCPFTTTDWVKIFDLSGVPKDVRMYKGGNYSWLAKTDIASLKNALAYSPVQLGIGCGETYYDEVVSPPKNIYSYHAVECYWIDDKYIYIFDSIQSPLKKLSINYPIQCAMSFRDLPDNWRDLQFMAKLERKKNEQKVHLIINGANYWIREEGDFDNLKADQPITNIQWENVKVVDELSVPWDGRKIIGSQADKDTLLKAIIAIFNKFFGKAK
jgi:hypothetical protein